MNSNPSAGQLNPSAPYEMYLSRLEYLKNEAAFENCMLNNRSHQDFKKFVNSMPNIRKGILVLLENGNLRLIWRDGQDTQLGLQFLGEEMIQYVFLNRRELGQPIAYTHGTDHLDGIQHQIEASKIDSLLYE